jgi:hypothetical protein
MMAHGRRIIGTEVLIPHGGGAPGSAAPLARTTTCPTAAADVER